MTLTEMLMELASLGYSPDLLCTGMGEEWCARAYDFSYPITEKADVRTRGATPEDAVRHLLETVAGRTPGRYL